MSSLRLVTGDDTEVILKDGRLLPSDLDAVLARVFEHMHAGGRENKQHANLMDVLLRQGIASNDPASDRGNFRYFPKGALMYELLSRWMGELLSACFDAQRVRTSQLLNWARDDIHEQASMFEDKLYHVQEPGDHDGSFVLRFNGDAGQFATFASANVNESQLPTRLYEMATCYRYLSKGEVSGIGRGRSFTLPDMHSFCAGQTQAKREYIDLTLRLQKVAEELTTSLGLVFKVPQGNYEDMRPTIVEIARQVGRPVIVRLQDVQTQYWCMKHMAFTDDGMPMFHVQLDFENGQRYGVCYTTKNGERLPCSVVHTTIGTVEWWLLHFLGRAISMELPAFPLWLSPTQVRVLPVRWNTHGTAATSLMKELNVRNIRADVDDREQRLGARIAAAGRDWIPFTVVLGDAEDSGGQLSVRMRDGSQEKMTFDHLVDHVRLIQHGKPFLPIPVRYLSRQLNFS